jgi:hypothetical protein
MLKLLLVTSIMISTLYSAPAFHGKRVYTQNDGTQFTGQLKGDEYLHWIESDDGTILRYNSKSKNFDYAKIESNELSPSGVVFQKKSAKKSRSLQELDNSSDNVTHEKLSKLWNQKRDEEMKRRKQ